MRGSIAKHVTKRDHIVAEIRRMIAEGELPRGSPMQQDVLAERFATSITPVREALRILEAEGLLIGEPHRGVRVADADYERVKTAYLLRRLVEPYAMRRAVRRLSRRDFDVAERVAEAMEEAAKNGDRVAFTELNREFHFLFYERAGNAGLAEQIHALWRQFPWDLLQVLSYIANEAASEHREILAAAREGDADRVARATEVHLARSFRRLAKHLTGSEVPDPFDEDND